MATLEDILKDVNNALQDSYSIPTNTDISQRSGYANQAVRDAAETGYFPEFDTHLIVSTSTGTYIDYGYSARWSIPLPANFRELVGGSVYIRSFGRNIEYPVIQLSDALSMKRSDRYACIDFNLRSGARLLINGTSSGATVSLIYQRFPTAMTTLTHVCELRDTEYVVAKTVSYVMQTYGDQRYPTWEAEAGRRLQNAIGRATISKSGALKAKVSAYPIK